ncbi:hypothetical protein K466DRAFT_178406 [Polyporus arcularius HHB13444]|uniref:Uncharacterized protein n=1 Tax=Polyporus arcularius HHB13444 TaxID=1314778 RepID=A0A5C3PA23_9APHY|nr:hypothetical protein K466DRAFT_178406 [Polyporus arcularius HHB13444]
MISDDLARALAILPWFMILCLIGLGAAFRYMQRRATQGSVDCDKWAYFSSLRGVASSPSATPRDVEDVQLLVPRPADPLIPHRRGSAPSSTLSVAASEPETIFSSGSVSVSVRNHGGHSHTPSRRSSGSSTITDPHPDTSLTPTISPSRSSHPLPSDDGFSVQTLSTIPPSYHTRRPEHELEPWTLPPAYGTPHAALAARPPSAYIPGRRVLRLNGPRSSHSLSSAFSNHSHPRDRKSTYATSVRTASGRGEEGNRSRDEMSSDGVLPGSSGGGPEGTQSGGGEGDMHHGWSLAAPSYHTVS